MRDLALGLGEAMEFGVRTDTGRVRNNNEDSYTVAPELNLFVLSDGMGGQTSGEIASQLATETVLSQCRSWQTDPSTPVMGERMEGVSDVTNQLVSAIRMANLAVYDCGQQNPAHHGMGATLVAAWFEGDRLSVAHVGDSRAYRLRNGELEQLTQDHSLLAEEVRRGVISAQAAERSQMQSVLLQALGAEVDVEVDVTEELVIEGDTILLCSDGLTRELSDAQIAALLGQAEDAQRAADLLVDTANQAGGEDNITAIVVRSAPKSARVFRRMGQLSRWLAGSTE
jgi:PPM family protein phosphatase